MLEHRIRFSDGFPGVVDAGIVFIKEGHYRNEFSGWVDGSGRGLAIMPYVALNFK